MDLTETQAFRTTLLDDVSLNAEANNDLKFNSFVYIFSEYLADAGLLNDFTYSHYKRPYKVGRKNARVDGYSENIFEETITLVIADYYGEAEPVTLTKTDAVQSFKECIAFIQDSFNGSIRNEIDKSDPAYYLAQLLYAAHKKEKVRKILGNYMGEYAENGKAELFDGAEDMLLDLKNQGHTLIFLSNCRVQYMERHKRIFRLDRFFDYFYCCEEYDFLPKYQIFRKISSRHSGQYIIIGDRFHDIETATKNGLKSIGCGYGYGTVKELEKSDIIVNNINEIPAAVKLLTEGL